MSWMQSAVLAWIQFVFAATVLLGAAWLTLRWIIQPVERIRLIQWALGTILVIPAISLAVPHPVWKLNLPVLATKPLDESVPRNVDSTVGKPLLGTSVHNTPADDVPLRMRMDAEMRRSEVFAAKSSDQSTVRTASREQLAANWNVWQVTALAIVSIHALAFFYFFTARYIGTRRLRRVITAAREAPSSVQTIWSEATGGAGLRVKLLVSPDLQTPLTFGWLHPVVVIPHRVADSDAASLRYCLAHEWSHVRRSDILALHGLWVCQLVLWYQPLFWVLRRELRICQDILADRASTPSGDDAISYSELLVTFARNRQTATMVGALTFFDHPSQLMRRVTMLLDRRTKLRPACTWRFTMVVALAAIATAGLVSTVRVGAVRASEFGEDPVSQQNESRTVGNAKAEEEPSPGDNSKPVAQGPDTPEQKPVRLSYSGMVLDRETGKGIPNATVTVERKDSTTAKFKLVAKTRHVTDADGRYSFEIPPEQSEMPTMYIQLIVEHEDYVKLPGSGYSLSMIRKNETLGERPFFERIALSPANRVTGKVVSPDGKPVAGAKIFGFTAAKPRDWNNFAWLDSKTNGDGSFHLNLIKGGPSYFWVLANDYAVIQREVENQQGDLGAIHLPQGIRIRGRVVSAKGKPVSGIAVNAYYEGPENEPLQSFSILSGIRRGTITDQDGKFTFEPLPPGDYRVVPEDELGDPNPEGVTQPLPGVFVPQLVSLKDGVAAKSLEIQGVPHLVFHSQYVTSAGEKTRGHEFWLSGQMDGQFWSRRVQPDPHGTATAYFPHGLQDAHVSLTTNEHSALRVRPGTGKPIENDYHNVRLGTLIDDVDGFEIIRYKAPIGLVKAIDTEGRPVRHFHVTAKYVWGKQQYILSDKQRSDLSFHRQLDGRYRTSQMLPDEEVTFTATAVGYEAASEKMKFAEGESKDVMITLKSVSAAVDTVNSAVDGALQLFEKALRPQKRDAP